MIPLVIGIDSGSTATKVAVYRPDGSVVATASAPTPRSAADSGRMERDAELHWRSVAEVVARVVSLPGVDARSIRAVGITAQGDGLVLIDSTGDPIGPAILSSDSRATGVVDRWRDEGVLETLLPVIGQTPFPGSPAALLSWIRDNQPERLEATRWMLSAKDWLRFRMTGEVATERTDAGASFVDVTTQSYSPRAMELYGLSAWSHLLPPALEPTDRAGTITAEAALLLGVPEGVPVVAGLHDAIATLVGSVGLAPGSLCVIAGTFGVNVVLSRGPTISRSINSRPGPRAGLWAPRRTSRASATNIDWAMSTLAGLGSSPSDWDAIDRALGRPPSPDGPIYLPYLFGGNEGQPGSASFFGLRNWHTSEDMLRAVLEGITFGHRMDIERLVDEVAVSSTHIAGGASRNPAWLQLFADVLACPVSSAPGDEAGVRGAAMCAAVGAGFFDDLGTAAAAMLPSPVTFVPGDAAGVLDASYRAYVDACALAAQFDRNRFAVPSLSP